MKKDSILTHEEFNLLQSLKPTSEINLNLDNTIKISICDTYDVYETLVLIKILTSIVDRKLVIEDNKLNIIMKFKDLLNNKTLEELKEFYEYITINNSVNFVTEDVNNEIKFNKKIDNVYIDSEFLNPKENKTLLELVSYFYIYSNCGNIDSNLGENINDNDSIFLAILKDKINDCILDKNI